MVSRSALFAEISSILRDSGIDTFRFDAQCIMEDSFGRQLPMILMNPDKEVPADTERQIREMTRLRTEGKPLQYILGQWEFYGYPFRVGEGVLIPRPDTETLIEQVLDICRENNLKSPEIVDLCSGSGCIAITLKKELPDARVTAVELSDNALEYTRLNRELNNADIRIIQGDVLSEETARSFENLDIIVSNPPYLTGEEMNDLQTEVAHEP